ncbi:unnamed protein product [Cyprideis torosa]|uniref:Uncharacterized protein n=1 Tax=Cyprideis torosa TaxID=163714 RepID=A0A7R8WCW0_9CRUS|nr:unnamed protein product [Cyprideis torosa]CAG0887915.1 unnamed protein product [Cyprideis torosa]
MACVRTACVTVSWAGRDRDVISGRVIPAARSTDTGCKNSCNHHGACALTDGMYHCQCQTGWGGEDCGIELETQCSDGVDNDRDGLVDCEDSECCVQVACAKSLMCPFTPDPVEVLSRKQPPAVTASFYQRMKFLIEEGSVQSYSRKNEYSDMRVSVVRGRVIDHQGLGIKGVRVSVNKQDRRFGFTMTRADGW